MKYLLAAAVITGFSFAAFAQTTESAGAAIYGKQKTCTTTCVPDGRGGMTCTQTCN